MSDNVDINNIHRKIMKSFDEYKNNIENYEKYRDILKDDSKNTEEIDEFINDIKNCISENFYISDSYDILAEYNEILNTPIKKSFVKKSTDTNIEKKNSLISAYLKIIEKYHISPVFFDSKKLSCNNCGHTEFSVIHECIHLCKKCYSQQYIVNNNMNYDDSSRINTSSKYMYECKKHFKDCIYHYQGIENCNIPEHIYEKLDSLMKLYKMDTKNLSKNMLKLLLVEAGYQKYMKNLNLIFNTITQTNLNDISHLESKLLEDFDKFIKVHEDEFNRDKKKSICTHYILYQLLKKHNHPVDQFDFNILKTDDIKAYHDEKTRIIFDKLGWYHSSF